MKLTVIVTRRAYLTMPRQFYLLPGPGNPYTWNEGAGLIYLGRGGIDPLTPTIVDPALLAASIGVWPNITATITAGMIMDGLIITNSAGILQDFKLIRSAIYAGIGGSDDVSVGVRATPMFAPVPVVARDPVDGKFSTALGQRKPFANLLELDVQGDDNSGDSTLLIPLAIIDSQGNSTSGLITNRNIVGAATRGGTVSQPNPIVNPDFPEKSSYGLVFEPPSPYTAKRWCVGVKNSYLSDATFQMTFPWAGDFGQSVSITQVYDIEVPNYTPGSAQTALGDLYLMSGWNSWPCTTFGINGQPIRATTRDWNSGVLGSDGQPIIVFPLSSLSSGYTYNSSAAPGLPNLLSLGTVTDTMNAWNRNLATELLFSSPL